MPVVTSAAPCDQARYFEQALPRTYTRFRQVAQHDLAILARQHSSSHFQQCPLDVGHDRLNLPPTTRGGSRA